MLNENRPEGDPAVRVIQQFESQLKTHQVCFVRFVPVPVPSVTGTLF